MARHQIILALVGVGAKEKRLVVARGPAVSRSAAQASVVLLSDLEYMLDLWNVFGAWVIYSIWAEHLHFLLCYKTPLVAEALLGKVLAATVADGLLVETALLFLPVAAHFGIPGVIHVRVDAGGSAARHAHALRVSIRYVHVCIAVCRRSHIIVVYHGRVSAECESADGDEVDRL